MKTIALCMIVKNEQEYLRRCLESVKDKVNQIVIVDTGSTDETISIANEYTNEVYHFDWINDFAAARNESIKYAKADYILVLDADEYLEDSVDILSSIEVEADYYFIKIHNMMSQGRAIDHLAIRIFANNKDLYYRNRLHEHLNTYEDEEKYKAGHAEFTIMHTGYTDDMLEGREKSKRNLSLMLKEVEENPNVYNLFNMGRTYNWTGNHGKAIEYLQRAYSLSGNLSIVPELVATLCRSLGEMKRYEEALYVLQEAVLVFPQEVDLVHLQALFFKEIGYYRDAIAKMNLCLEIGDQGITVTEGNGSYLAHFRLAEWYEERNDLVKSYEHILEAFKLNMNFIPVMGKYFKIVEKANIPLDDVFISIKQLYTISNSAQLERLLEVLYQLRHPLLHRFITEYNVIVQDSVEAIAYQYVGEYEKSRDKWITIDEITDQNGEDILLLSILLKDENLFKISRPLLNLSVSEQKKLQKCIFDISPGNLKLTTHTESLLEKSIIHLIRLHEFETFESVLGCLWNGGIDIKMKICEHLIAYGFNEIAIDLLVKLYEHNSRNESLNLILGDVCYKSNYFEDANLFYSRISPRKYEIHEHLYEVNSKMGNQNEKEIIIEEIKKLFPICQWVKTEL